MNHSAIISKKSAAVNSPEIGSSRIEQGPLRLRPLDVASADPIIPDQTSVVTSSEVEVDGEMFDCVFFAFATFAAYKAQ